MFRILKLPTFFRNSCRFSHSASRHLKNNDLCLFSLASGNANNFFKNSCKSLVPLVKFEPSYNQIIKEPLKPVPIISDVNNKPFISKIDHLDLFINHTIKDPTIIIERKAARLIVIRRRKMRRHKLKKLRIRMKFFWAKLRHRREVKKEKAFQAEILAKVSEAKSFDPVAYATEKIKKAHEVPLPKLWKGKRLPEFVIKDLIAAKKKKEQAFLEKQARRDAMNLKASDYKFD